MSNINTNGIAFDWDSEIQNDSDFITLEEGDYTFTVASFERGRFPGSEKIPACNKATLNLTVETPNGIATIKTDLIMHSVVEWKLSEFFRCIGQKKHGEKLRMNWSAVPGSKGRAHFKPRKYKTNGGEEREVNDVTRFLEYDAAAMMADMKAPF